MLTFKHFFLLLYCITESIVQCLSAEEEERNSNSGWNYLKLLMLRCLTAEERMIFRFRLLRNSNSDWNHLKLLMLRCLTAEEWRMKFRFLTENYYEIQILTENSLKLLMLQCLSAEKDLGSVKRGEENMVWSKIEDSAKYFIIVFIWVSILLLDSFLFRSLIGNKCFKTYFVSLSSRLKLYYLWKYIQVRQKDFV